MDWKILLTYITGSVEQELLLRNESLVTENRILRHQIQGRIRLNDGERQTRAEVGQRLGQQALAEVVTIVTTRPHEFFDQTDSHQAETPRENGLLSDDLGPILGV